MAPAPTPAPTLFIRQLATTSSSSAPASTSSAVTGSFFGGATGSSIVNFVAVVAGVSVIGSILLWRFARLRKGGLPLTLRAFLFPCGVRVRKLGVNIKPVARVPMPPPPAPARATEARRQRRSRRTTTGPDIGVGGRRLSTGVPGERDEVDEDGRSIAGVDEELPNYSHDKLPTYGSVWTPSQAPGHGDEPVRSSREAERSPAVPGTEDANAVPLSDLAYETYIRNLPPSYQDEAIARPAPALRRGDTDL